MSVSLRALFLCSALCSPLIAEAGTLSEAQITGQVQQTFDADGVSSCGVVLAAVEIVQGPPVGKLLIFNGSFSLGSLSGGLIKGRASEIDARRVASGKSTFSDVKPLLTTNIWMKSPEGPRTVPMAMVPIQPSDDPGYLIYGSAFDSVISLLRAIIEKQSIQVGFRVRGAKFDQALFGVVEMSSGQLSQLTQCMGEWASTMKKKYKSDDAPSVQQDGSKP